MTNDKQNAATASRRAFLQRSAGLGAAAAAILLGGSKSALGAIDAKSVTPGDIAVLKFLAAAELVETDLWDQYTELATLNHGFNRALTRIDKSLPRYITNDRDDELSHANLINAFLQAIGQPPVNLDPFRTLPPVNATGASNIGRLTNLTNLTVDTSWYNRYRNNFNPDLLNVAIPQYVTITERPAVPTSNSTVDETTMQAIANTAAYHFCAIEQGGGSLYNALTSNVTSPDVLAILASIGPTEVYHFAVFQTALEDMPGLVTDDGLVFPDNKDNIDVSQGVMPKACSFLDLSFPVCSVIRPRSIAKAGAVAAATGLVNSGLFKGQTQQFFDAVVALATAADSAVRGV